jgi:hypothetical protein
MTWKDMYVEVPQTHGGGSDSVTEANLRWLDAQEKPEALVLSAPWYEVDDALEKQRPVFVAVSGGFWYVRRDVFFEPEAAESLMSSLPREEARACGTLLEGLERVGGCDGVVVIDESYHDGVIREREAVATSDWLDDILAGRWCTVGRHVFACPEHMREALKAADAETKAEAKQALEEAIQPLLGNEIDFADDFTFVVAKTIGAWRVVRRTLAEVLGVEAVSLRSFEEIEAVYTHWLYLLTKRLGLLSRASVRYDLLRNNDADLEYAAFLLDGTGRDTRLRDDWKQEAYRMPLSL